MTLDPRALLRQLYDVAVARALPGRVLATHLPPPPKGRTLVLGAGKAGASMAQALEAAWPADAPLSGLVITRYGHIPGGWRPRRLEVVEAAHPVPDAAGLAATERLLALAHGLTADDLVICLISGGGSALMSLPAPGLLLSDKQAVNRALLNSGAAIHEMNCVRKHLSGIKGGRLAAACAPARVLTLAISDVPGDDPAVIASGPTQAARAGLESGAFETPKPGDARLAGHELVMLATPQMSLEAAAEAARAQGLAAHILSDEIEGESRVVGGLHAALARAVARRGQPFARPCVILSGGETTVTVDPALPAGKGGRATEFLLGCALALQGEPGVFALAADTDGIDGVGPHAGALLTPTSLGRARALGLSPQALLDAHDSASFFAPLGDLLVPGPSFTNVNDFRALLVL